MRITKELQSKVHREFDKKKREKLAIVSAKISAEKAILQKRYLKLLEDWQKDPVSDSALFVDALLRDNYRGTVEKQAERAANYTELPVITELKKEQDAIHADFKLQEENFLIHLSYSKDIADIQKVFADFGLTF